MPAPLLDRIASACREVGSADPGVVAFYLFGSHAAGDARAESDVDLGVLFAGEAGLDRVLGLEAELERRIGRSVDLVDAASCDPFLALDVIRGERLYCTDGERCDLFDLYVLRRAGDLAPFERERRRMLLGEGA